MKETYQHEFNYWQCIVAMITTMWRINKDSIDFKWGYFAPRFGLELQLNQGGYFSSNYSINICFLWGAFHIIIPFKTNRPESCEWLSYGVSYFENGFIWRWGHLYKRWDLPFINYVFEFHCIKTVDGNFEPYKFDSHTTKKEDFDYSYTLRSGDKQHVKATCTEEVWQWHRKWFPLLKKRRRSIDVEFSDEVGEESGSWKGGCIGCGYDMLPNETVEQCLRRMEKERKF